MCYRINCYLTMNNIPRKMINFYSIQWSRIWWYERGTRTSFLSHQIFTKEYFYPEKCYFIKNFPHLICNFLIFGRYPLIPLIQAPRKFLLILSYNSCKKIACSAIREATFISNFLTVGLFSLLHPLWLRHRQFKKVKWHYIFNEWKSHLYRSINASISNGVTA